MVQNEVMRRTRVSIQKIEDKTRQSIVRLEQRLHLKRKAVVRALASLCLPLLAIIMVIVNPVPKLGKLYMAMSEGFNGYAMLESPPIGIYVRIFVFNVTNSEKFLSGEENMKVQEIGPFTYLEHRTNSNMSVDWERGVLRFIPRLNVTFVPERSIGHPRDFPLIVPNLALLTTTAMLVDYSMWTNIAFNVLLANLGTKQFKKMTADDYMWGFTDELTQMAHTVLPGWLDSPKMGLMKQFYEDFQDEKFMEVDATFENRYRIRSWDGQSALPQWADGTKTGSVCNRLNGSYEAMFFTAGFTTETTFDIYRRQICRTMPMRYESTNYTSFGVKLLQFTPADDAFEPNQENDCVSKKNLPRGLSDISPCYKGLSLAISQPHFLDSDPSVFYKLEGLKPDRKVHGTLMGIDPEMGLPLEASSSSQSNAVIGDAKYSSIGKPFSNMIVPLLWLNMKYQEIPDNLQAVLRWRFIYGPALQIALEVALFVGGVLLLAYNVLRYMRPWSMTMDYQTIPMVEKEMEIFVHKNPLMDDIDL